MGDLLAGIEPGPEPRVADLDRWVDPLDAFDDLRGRRHPALLLSGLEGHPASRYSILASDPLYVVALRGTRGVVSWAPDSGHGRGLEVSGDPFELLRRLAPEGANRGAGGVPFAGGAIGYLGYGLRRWVEELPAGPGDPLGLPDAWFGIYDAAVVFDHVEHRVAVVSTCLGPPGGPFAEHARKRHEDLLQHVRQTSRRCPPAAAAGTGGRRPAILTTRHEDYLERIDRALEYIAAGDVYQVNLSHRIECGFEGDPMALFCELAGRNPAPFAAYLDTGRFQVVSASPERFVSLRGGVARSSPIKGTRPRGADGESDRLLALELMTSEKDRAENVMIADLVRNDLGRVCSPGSVRVDRLCALESFATVHHLVSTVRGRMRPGCDRVDLLRALFPGGSMTGAPKVRAMEVIDELEGEERGIYAGGLGYLGFDGGSDFNIVIRTVICLGGRAHVRVGGAILAESDPEREYIETLDKGRALLDVLRVDVRSRL